MPPKAHAVLSASSSDRWMHCPPSARLCESIRDNGSDYAAEGTDAHILCEHKLKSALGIRSKDPTEDLSWYDAEMEDCASECASYIMELVADVKKTCSDPHGKIIYFYRNVTQRLQLQLLTDYHP